MKVVKTIISGVYLTGLIIVWHIPAVSVDLGYKMFYACSYATFNALTPPSKTMPKLIE